MAPSKGKREQAKEQRRERLLDAAGQLLRAVGYDDFSMLQVAKRAEVSEKTLYNLFETKAAIFARLFNRDLREFRDTVARTASGEDFSDLFGAIDVAAQFFERDPNLYKAMARLAFSTDEGIATLVAQPRKDFWDGQLRDVAATGLLRSDTDMELLSAAAASLLTGAFLDWASGKISADTYARVCQYGLASLLQPHASSDAQSMLRDHVELIRERTAS